VERPADLAAHDLGLGRARLDQCCLSHHVGVALERAVGVFDTCELRCGGLYRRDFACVHAARQFGELEIVEG